MRSERMCSLARHLSSLSNDAAGVYANQWLERSLDDSAARRIFLPDAYLSADSILIILDNIASGLHPYPAIIKRNLMAELPFMSTENIIMALVAKGVSRQEAHEKIRVHSHAAGRVVKVGGKDNDLIERVHGDPFFKPILDDLPKLLDPKTFIGRAPEQVEKFTGVGSEVDRALKPYKEAIAKSVPAQLER